MRPKSHLHFIGDILEKLLPKAKWEQKRKQYALWEQWEAVVGIEIAKQTEPLQWQGATLVIGVKDSCWLQELRMREREILEKLRRFSPELKITGIRFKIAEKSG